jgi:hypothetical protein
VQNTTDSDNRSVNVRNHNAPNSKSTKPDRGHFFYDLLRNDFLHHVEGDFRSVRCFDGSSRLPLTGCVDSRIGLSGNLLGPRTTGTCKGTKNHDRIQLCTNGRDWIKETNEKNVSVITDSQITLRTSSLSAPSSDSVRYETKHTLSESEGTSGYP